MEVMTSQLHLLVTFVGGWCKANVGRCGHDLDHIISAKLQTRNMTLLGLPDAQMNVPR